MSTYIQKQIVFRVSDRQNIDSNIFKRGDRLTKFEAIADLNECEAKKYAVPIPTVDKDLIEGTTITLGKILYIETDQEITVKLNAVGDTGFKVTPIVDGDDERPGQLYLETEFTHVYVSVAGASGEANIIMCVLGA